MNCPSRVDPECTEGYNQSPDAFNGDATTRADMDRVANARLRSDHRIDPASGSPDIQPSQRDAADRDDGDPRLKMLDGEGNVKIEERGAPSPSAASPSRGGGSLKDFCRWIHHRFPKQGLRVLRRYTKFIGPGFMVAVAYIDPGKPPF